MATTDEDWARLGALVRDRRDELRKTQQQVQHDGGPSVASQRTVESGKGRSSMLAGTRRDYEKALDWRRGSFDDILRGGDPAPASEPVEIPNVRQHLGPNGEPGGYEVTKTLKPFDLMKLFALALATNALSEAASEFAEGDESPDRLATMAQRAHKAAIELLAQVLDVDADEARETARQMGYLFGDVSDKPSK